MTPGILLGTGFVVGVATTSTAAGALALAAVLHRRWTRR